MTDVGGVCDVVVVAMTWGNKVDVRFGGGVITSL